MSRRRASLARRLARVAVLLVVGLIASSATLPRVSADSYQRISGEGSSWAANAIDAMRVNVRQFGITVDYNPSGSTAGRKDFLNGTVDFAASDIPFQFTPEDGSAPENPAPGSYAYMPVTAGGTAFMYNLKINGKQVTNLRLSGQNVAKLFTGVIKMWNDPAIQADNPGLTLPARAVVPVVRSDGSGSTAQFTLWMINRFPDIWNAYCAASGRAPACGSTSFYPAISGMISQQGDLGVAGYVSQSFAEGAIGYVNYSYALGTQFPVAKVLNAAGYYTEPTPQNVAVSLLQAKINTDQSNPATYLTQDLTNVYTDGDPRNYQLSSYSYLILPTTIAGQFNEAKGKTLAAFSYYAMCQAQQQSASLGYSPMPVNLVQASFDQITKIPGAVVQDINIASCKNPTFSPDGTNVLAKNAPQPLACDKQGPLQCPNGTGGLANVATAINPAAAGGTAAPTATTAPPAAAAATTTPGAATATTTPAAGAPAGGTPTASTTAAAAGGATATTTAGATPAAPGGATASGGGATTATTATPRPASGGSTASGATATTTAAGTGTATAADPTATVDPAAAPVDANGDGIPDSVVETTTPNCDADTGLCASADAAPAAGPVVVGGQTPAAGVPVAAQTAAVGPITPTTLNQNGGWGSSLVLTLIVIALTLGLVLVPALAWRHYSSARPS